MYEGLLSHTVHSTSAHINTNSNPTGMLAVIPAHSLASLNDLTLTVSPFYSEMRICVFSL